MGAKFAPSVTNLFLAQWEEESVYKHTPPELLLYKRYTDDVIIVWRGSKGKRIIFLDGLNQNARNILLTWDISKTTISYLDLEIIQIDNKLITKTYFKSVDRNSYLSIESCHHKNWLYDIPKGQMLRLRLNCTNVIDYTEQPTKVGQRFINKGYDRRFIEETTKEILEMEKSAQINDKERINQQTDRVSIILEYIIQHKQVERIIRCYWHILQVDKHLYTVPYYRINQHLCIKRPQRDKIVKRVIYPP